MMSTIHFGVMGMRQTLSVPETGSLDMDIEGGPLVGRVSGTYKNTAIHFMALNAEWRF